MKQRECAIQSAHSFPFTRGWRFRLPPRSFYEYEAIPSFLTRDSLFFIYFNKSIEECEAALVSGLIVNLGGAGVELSA